MKNKVEFLEHTGDIGLRVRAGNLDELFALAAEGMFSIICPRAKIEKIVARDIVLESRELQELFVNWLSELNYFFCTEQELVGECDILEVSATRIRARVFGERVDPARHQVHTEIKAVTYHMLDIAPKEDGWEARVLFDI